jgi:hypothetical protein
VRKKYVTPFPCCGPLSLLPKSKMRCHGSGVVGLVGFHVTHVSMVALLPTREMRFGGRATY